MATEPLARLLRENADLAPVRNRLDQVKRLQGLYRSVVPVALASSSRVCAVDGTTVVVRADNAPVAAALRAIAPRLLAGLNDPATAATGPPEKKPLKNKQDQELTALRVEIQVDVPAPPRKVRPRDDIPVERLAEVARGLSASPLKDALDRIVQAQRKSSTRSKR
ncbi:MAG TPA: DciA family protein [Usitatibacteraceae bacterium]|nr:DciA family protein [Usitatibacteraceae bacterium]